MLNNELKEELAEEYADSENSAWTNDYNGFIAGWDAAQQALQQCGVSGAQSAELLRAFIQEIRDEFKDQNWDYLDYIAERVLARNSR